MDEGNFLLKISHLFKSPCHSFLKCFTDHVTNHKAVHNQCLLLTNVIFSPQTNDTLCSSLFLTLYLPFHLLKQCLFFGYKCCPKWSYLGLTIYIRLNKYPFQIIHNMEYRSSLRQGIHYT